jgi:hypothetical protein
VEIRIGPNPTPLMIPFISLPAFEYHFNLSTQFNSNLLNFLLRCYSYCLRHPRTSLIPRLAPFQYFPNVCRIIYVFNMIIPAFEFFYSSSCGLVIACFSCRLSTFRACTSAHKKIVRILMTNRITIKTLIGTCDESGKMECNLLK